MQRRLGLTIPMVPQDLRWSCELARRARDWGYTDAWTMESGGTDGFAVSAALGMTTEDLRIGCAIVPATTRPPALIAMGAATAQQACDGRFCLGLGSSSPTIVERWMGLRYELPYTRVRETLEVVRSALRGEKVAYHGRTVEVSGFRLETEPREVPIFLAALGPRMMDLARTEHTGIALFLAAEEGIRRARRTAPEAEILQRVIVVPETDPAEVRAFARWMLAPYVAVPGYRDFIAQQGFEEDAAASAGAWARGDRKASLAALSDRLVDALVVWGPAGKIEERILALRGAGLDTPILMPLSTRGPEAAAAVLEELAGV